MKKFAPKMGKTKPILAHPASAPAIPIRYTARPSMTLKQAQTPHIGLNLGLG